MFEFYELAILLVLMALFVLWVVFTVLSVVTHDLKRTRMQRDILKAGDNARRYRKTELAARPDHNPCEYKCLYAHEIGHPPDTGCPMLCMYTCAPPTWKRARGSGSVLGD